jgi:hypothetical protein
MAAELMAAPGGVPLWVMAAPRRARRSELYYHTDQSRMHPERFVEPPPEPDNAAEYYQGCVNLLPMSPHTGAGSKAFHVLTCSTCIQNVHLHISKLKTKYFFNWLGGHVVVPKSHKRFTELVPPPPPTPTPDIHQSWHCRSPV